LFDYIPLERAVSNQTYGFFLVTYGREEADKLLYVEPAEVQHDFNRDSGLDMVQPRRSYA
jgi:hypothetical protein